MKYPLESNKLATLQIHRTNLLIICESGVLMGTVIFNALIKLYYLLYHLDFVFYGNR